MTDATPPTFVVAPDAYPSRDTLASLGRKDRLRARRTAYFGDTLTLSLGDLPAEHAAIIRRLYDFLLQLNAFAAERRSDGLEALPAVAAFAAEHGYEELRAQTLTLSAAMVADDTAALVRKTYHDLRGGSFTSLCGYLDMIIDGEAGPEDVVRVFLLTRDHLKIMRNAVHDLDRAAYERDLGQERHAVELLREKWTSVLHHSSHGSARVIIDCTFTGWVSNRCMEFSALDRVLYNLINNAAEHTADDTVLLRAFPIDEDVDTHLRFAVCNHVTPAQSEYLYANIGDDLGQMYEGGFTTTGHGIGMGICGDIVSHSYGLRTVRDACKQGYMGVDIVDDCFVAWFHWPARRDENAASAA
ncbi:HAMP domain-containing histidine kinase [Haliangium ochraceum]|uniref:Uncharacterized protein n=1 Tax=Haliangium ochraceum (strain DSM 14365 / JCM 11303 / SMP-2) TaxID=502025 RepID=D0LH87_HALO1|nr:HAMP domain-containing histidine kinase [Haliangium ochraceum]ACY18232.1 hypothetical protein Hoch_5755 [Haliangium ochraceum DSM 14365]